jgi:hypothetical protein
MTAIRRAVLFGTSALCLGGALPWTARAAEGPLEISMPMTPPEWALLERAVIDQQTAACKAFFDRDYDASGFLLVISRWGGDDPIDLSCIDHSG